MRIATCSLDVLPAAIASWHPHAVISAFSPSRPMDRPWDGPWHPMAFHNSEGAIPMGIPMPRPMGMHGPGMGHHGRHMGSGVPCPWTTTSGAWWHGCRHKHPSASSCTARQAWGVARPSPSSPWWPWGWGHARPSTPSHMPSLRHPRTVSCSNTPRSSSVRGSCIMHRALGSMPVGGTVPWGMRRGSGRWRAPPRHGSYLGKRNPAGSTGRGAAFLVSQKLGPHPA